MACDILYFISTITKFTRKFCVNLEKFNSLFSDFFIAVWKEKQNHWINLLETIE